jgi:hypothetical protein
VALAVSAAAVRAEAVAEGAAVVEAEVAEDAAAGAEVLEVAAAADLAVDVDEAKAVDAIAEASIRSAKAIWSRTLSPSTASPRSSKVAVGSASMRLSP